MNLPSLILAALVLVPAFALATWVWFAMVSIEDDLQAFEGHGAMDFKS